jgi:hypothetical protein
MALVTPHHHRLAGFRQSAATGVGGPAENGPPPAAPPVYKMVYKSGNGALGPILAPLAPRTARRVIRGGIGVVRGSGCVQRAARAATERRPAVHRAGPGPRARSAVDDASDGTPS